MKRAARFIGAVLMLLIVLFAFASCSKDAKYAKMYSEANFPEDTLSYYYDHLDEGNILYEAMTVLPRLYGYLSANGAFDNSDKVSYDGDTSEDDEMWSSMWGWDYSIKSAIPINRINGTIERKGNSVIYDFHMDIADWKYCHIPATNTMIKGKFSKDPNTGEWETDYLLYGSDERNLNPMPVAIFIVFSGGESHYNMGSKSWPSFAELWGEGYLHGEL